MAKKTSSSAEPAVPVSQDITLLQAEIKTLDENWKRALADYQNLLRRVEHDKREFTKISNANLIARLLPCLDIIELAAVHTSDVGVQMAAKQFHEALVQEGLEIIAPAPGEPFNHLFQEASDIVPAGSDHPENTIAELLLKGYKIGDYILRPAKVKVYQPAPVEASQEDNDG